VRCSFSPQVLAAIVASSGILACSDNSVLEGQPVTPISAEERELIRKRHSWHTIYPPPR
jgi:hypothetical protein